MSPTHFSMLFYPIKLWQAKIYYNRPSRQCYTRFISPIYRPLKIAQKTRKKRSPRGFLAIMRLKGLQFGPLISGGPIIIESNDETAL